MTKKTVALLICASLAFSAFGCAGQSDTSSAKAPASEETAAAEPAAEGAEETAAEEAASAAQTIVDKDALEASSEITTGEIDSAVNALEAAPGGTVPDNGSAGEENYDAVYEYVNVKIDGTNLIVIPNGTVNDDTVIYNEKTLGALCDYIDSNVLDSGRTINRKFLYGLVSTQVIDPKMMSSYEQFNRTMIYCLTIANEFYSVDVTLNDLILDTTNNTKQVFEVTAEGKDDSWILDGHEKKFYLNGGSTEYTSSMFDSQTLAVWSFVLDDFFEVK
jgi:hypothetical protein